MNARSSIKRSGCVISDWILMFSNVYQGEYNSVDIGYAWDCCQSVSFLAIQKVFIIHFLACLQRKNSNWFRKQILLDELSVNGKGINRGRGPSMHANFLPIGWTVSTANSRPSWFHCIVLNGLFVVSSLCFHQTKFGLLKPNLVSSPNQIWFDPKPKVKRLPTGQFNLQKTIYVPNNVSPWPCE